MKKPATDATEVELIPLNETDRRSSKNGNTSIAENKSGIEWARLRKRIFLFMDSPGVQAFLVSLLIFSLYVADSWVLGNQHDDSTHVLDGLLTTVLVIFIFEVVTLTLVEPDYWLSFFFFMDVLGTISIVLDINYMSENFLPNNQHGSILRATRTAKLGARYGRLMRILKLIRFFKYVPCMGKRDDIADPEPTASSLRRVTNQLSNMISQRVAGLVMILVIVVPFLGYPTADYSAQAWMAAIKGLAKNPATLPAEFQRMCARFESFYKHKDVKLAHLVVHGPTPALTFDQSWATRPYVRSANLNTFRINYSATSHGAPPLYEIAASMDYTAVNQYDAVCGIILVSIVIFILVSFSASFQSQVEVLVVEPLEKMLLTLRSSAAVMLKSMNAVEKETGAEEGDSDDDGELETLQLEKMVEKLSRIIKLTYPSGNDIDMDENVDSKTAGWLAETFSSMGVSKKEKVDFIIEEDEDEEKKETNDDPLHEEERKRLNSVSDKNISAIRNIELLDGWDFDVLEYQNAELLHVTRHLFEVLHLFEEFAIRMPVFDAFVAEVAQRYVNTNTYHNFKHGVDVMFTVYRLILDSKVHMSFSQLEMLAVMTASLTHDVGHPGVNNVYLVKAKHRLALKYNDRSPLENMHCAVTYDILGKDETNLFSSLTNGQWREARTVILTSVLGTDMSHHFEQISKTQLFLEVNKDDVHSYIAGNSETITCLEDGKNRLFLLELCLHCADVSNPYKPFALCGKWAKLVVEEFSLQGDREKAEGLEVSPMCDRETVNLCNMQMGFIEFVVAPLVLAVVNLLYPLHIVAETMVSNFVQWSLLRRDEINSDGNIVDKEEEARKLDNRVGAFRAKFACVEVLAAKPQRASKTRVMKFQRVASFKSKTAGGLPVASPSPSPLKKVSSSVGSPRQKRILGKE